MKSHLLPLAAAYLALAGPVLSGPSDVSEIDVRESSPLAEWWDGKYASGDWFGLRDTLEDRGIQFEGRWRATFYGITGGGLHSPRGAFDEEIVLGLKLDFAKLLGVDALEGLTATGAARWRDGYNPNAYVGASSTFQPSRYQSGVQWRLMPFYLTYTTPELLGVKEFLTISGGWQNAYEFFADQPESKLFTNSAIGTAKGIGGVNGGPWSSSYAAWGGYLKVKPTSWYYAMGGLYMAIPEASATSNHGLYLEGFTPEPSDNGLYAIGETGVTPKLGEAKLPGKYAFGAIYFGLENTSFFGETYDQKFNFYWQADQMLFREASPEPAPLLGKGASDGKSFKSSVSAEKPKLSDQGLYAFSFVNYAPKYNNAMPFYFHSGLVYKGLIPSRDKDQLGVAFAYGNYSYYKILDDYNDGRSTHQTYEALVEIDYRVQLSKFLFVQPFWQYIIRPNGTGLVENANILGLHMGATF